MQFEVGVLILPWKKKLFKIHVGEKWIESFADAAYETKWTLQSIMVKATAAL